MTRTVISHRFKPKLFPLFVSIGFLTLALLSCTSGKQQLPAGLSTREPMVIEVGDLVSLDYTISLAENGAVLHTALESRASETIRARIDTGKNGDGRHGDMIVAGKEAPYPQLEALVLGMSPGERKAVSISNAFGPAIPELTQTFPRIRSVPKSATQPVNRLVKLTGEYPRPGVAFGYGPYFMGTVEQVLGDEISLTVRPTNTRFEESFGTVHITDGGDVFIVILDPEVGKPFHLGDEKGIIVSKDKKSLTVDFNDPLAGKDFLYDIHIRSVIKASQAGSMRINWIDRYDKGLEVAEKLQKPAVVVLYAEQCRYCEKLFSVAMEDPRIRALNETFVWIKLEATDNEVLKRKYGLRAYPLTVIVSYKGEIISKISGYKDPANLRKALMRGLVKLTTP